MLNPWFMTAFLGTAAVSLILLILSVLLWPEPGSGFGLAGSLLHLVGSFLVTIVCNVPRNEALARVQPADTDSAARWAGYLAGWTAWKHVRTVAALAAAAGFIIGLGVSDRSGAPRLRLSAPALNPLSCISCFVRRRWCNGPPSPAVIPP